MKKTLGLTVLGVLAGAVILALPLYADWGSDTRLAPHAGSQLTSHTNAWCVAAKSDSVHVVWEDYRDVTGDEGGEIYYKRSADGGVNWGSDTRLTYDASGSGHPSVAVSTSKVHVVWEEYRDGNLEIYYKRSTNGGTDWESDTRLSFTSNTSARPSIAISGSKVHVVWYEGSMQGYDVYYILSTDGGASWGSATQLTTSGNAHYPSVAVADTMVHVVWYDGRDGNNEIYYKRSTDGGQNWGSDTRLTSDSHTSDLPCIAVKGSKVHVVWYDNRDGNYEIYYKRSNNSGGTWGSDTRLTNNQCWQGYPNIAASSSNSNVHVVWRDRRDSQDGTDEIYYKRSPNDGVNWGSDTRLTYNSAYSYNPSVALGGDKVHVVWHDIRDGDYQIYYKRDPTGNQTPPNTDGGSIWPITNEAGGNTISENRVEGQTRTLSILPNPFISFARVVGHEGEKFGLYDFTGRQVDICRGSRIGERLSPGVYFLRPLNGTGSLFRLVKMR